MRPSIFQQIVLPYLSLARPPPPPSRPSTLLPSRLVSSRSHHFSQCRTFASSPTPRPDSPTYSPSSASSQAEVLEPLRQATPAQLFRQIVSAWRRKKPPDRTGPHPTTTTTTYSPPPVIRHGRRAYLASSSRLPPVRTAARAIRFILLLYSPPTPTADPSASSAVQGQISGRSLPTSSPTTWASQAKLRPLPPLIHTLLARRFFRLAVYHILTTPSLHAETQLLAHVAFILDKKGAGRLARRLERTFLLHPSSSTSSLPLAHVPRKDLPPGASPYQRRVPLADVTSPSQLRPDTWVAQHTMWYNQHLDFLVRQKPRPYLAWFSDRPLRRPTMPPPSPDLGQLAALLDRVERLQRFNGYQPDRVTANLVLRCWICCGLGAAKRLPPGTDPRRYRRGMAPGAYDLAEVMAVYAVVRRGMEAAMEAMEGDENAERLSMSKHVRPAVGTLRGALRRVEEGARWRSAVVAWERDVEDKLYDLQTRADLLEAERVRRIEEVQRAQEEQQTESKSLGLVAATESASPSATSTASTPSADLSPTLSENAQRGDESRAHNQEQEQQEDQQEQEQEVSVPSRQSRSRGPSIERWQDELRVSASDRLRLAQIEAEIEERASRRASATAAASA